MSGTQRKMFLRGCLISVSALPSGNCWAQFGSLGSSISGGFHHVGGVISDAGHHAGGVVSDATHHAGGVVSDAGHHAGGVVSDATRHAASVVSSKTSKIIGPNERTTLREAYQGAALGAAKGAASGGGLAGIMLGPEAIGAGAAAGASSGAIGGGVMGFGQGVFDTNKNYFEAHDPGRLLPHWARPNTDIRLGYQAFLKSAAGEVVGDYSVDSTKVWAKPLLTSTAVGVAGAVGAGAAEIKQRWNHVDYTDLRHHPAPQPPSGAPDQPVHTGTIGNSIAALHRAGRPAVSDPFRGVQPSFHFRNF